MIIHWFRQDLRLADNPAFSAAIQSGKVLSIYILDDNHPGKHKMGSASRWWLHYSLESLNQSLRGKLNIYVGDPLHILQKLAEQHHATAIFWNRCYEPWRIERDKQLKASLQDKIEIKSFNGSLLWEPWKLLKADNSPYRVFTPFYRNSCLKAPTPRQPVKKPETLFLEKSDHSLTVDDLGLLPKIAWDKQLEPHWKIGEAAAKERLENFLEDGLTNYKQGRNFPARKNISKLSPHLHFGEISPNQVWHAVKMSGDNDDIDHFCSELAWREFSYSLLYFNPELPEKNLQSKFDAFPWRKDGEALKSWQQGQTGYPIVDAGMRELWQTGFMHNRVRMIVGSFLVKNLLIHWHQGERWFWDCLVDADLANNSASWQWIAGCGADAAPYFRIFNPVTQGQKFDPHGQYTRHYVPELQKIPDKYLFNPFEAPPEILEQAGVKLGENYPQPIVALKVSRERALDAFKQLRAQ